MTILFDLTNSTKQFHYKQAQSIRENNKKREILKVPKKKADKNYEMNYSKCQKRKRILQLPAIAIKLPLSVCKIKKKIL